MTKKIVVVSLVAVALVLAGCSKKDKADDKNSKKLASTKPADKTKPAKTADESATADKTKTGDKTAAAGAIPPPKVPVATTDKGEKLGEGVDWTKVSKESPAPEKAKEKLDPSKISNEGVAKPIRGFTLTQPSKASVYYGPTKKYAQVKAALEKIGFLQKEAAYINRVFNLHQSFPILFTDCNQPNAFFDPSHERILMCYDFPIFMMRLFKAKGAKDPAHMALAATLGVFWHEFGHAATHFFKLPVVGKEENAVDQFSVLMLLEQHNPLAIAADAQAMFFLHELKEKSGKGFDWADEHGPGRQRFYDMMCLMFGSDPQKFGGIVTNGWLPKRRARRCAGAEFKKVAQSWRELLVTKHAIREDQLGKKPQPPTTAKAPLPGPPPPKPGPNPNPGASREQLKKRICNAAAVRALKLFVAALKARGAPQNTIEAKSREVQKLLPKLSYECQTKWPVSKMKCALNAKTFQAYMQCK